MDLFCLKLPLIIDSLMFLHLSVLNFVIFSQISLVEGVPNFINATFPVEGWHHAVSPDNIT